MVNDPRGFCECEPHWDRENNPRWARIAEIDQQKPNILLKINSASESQIWDLNTRPIPADFIHIETCCYLSDLCAENFLLGTSKNHLI